MTESAKRAGIVGKVFAWVFFLLVAGYCVWSTLWRLNRDHEAYNWRAPANPVVKKVTGRFTEATLTKSYRYGYRFVPDRGEAMSFYCEAGGQAGSVGVYQDCLTNYPEELKDLQITVRYYEAKVHPGSSLPNKLILGLERDGDIVFQRPVSNTY